ncbi:hypothetical protein ACHAXS_012339 [Conticribra weissflogii]
MDRTLETMEQRQAEIFSNHSRQEENKQNEETASNEVKIQKEHCSCSNECDLLEKVPLDHGIMIVLHDPSTFRLDNPKSQQEQQIHENYCENHHRKSACHPCSCLKIKLQKDANIPQFHPNICVPSSLLEDPSKLVKYGGGGSGVTVFGGYHPDLGSLVMKHGGHKDLIELVSLAKIERELSVRAKWKIDELRGVHRESKENDEESSGCEQGTALQGSSAHSEGVSSQLNGDGRRNPSGNSLGGSDHPVPKLSERVRRLGINPFAELKKITSNPLLVTFNSMRNIVQSTGVKRSSTGTGLDSMTKIRENCDVTPEEQHESSGYTTTNEIFHKQRAIQNAVEDMKRRIPAFRMIYISPMHLRERADELATRSFRSRVMTADVGGEKHLDPHDATMTSIDSGNGNQNQQQKNGDSNDTSTANLHNDLEHRNISNSIAQRRGRSIKLFGAPNVKSSSFQVHRRHVDLCFGGSFKLVEESVEKTIKEDEEDSIKFDNGCLMCHSGTEGDGRDGYASLMAFVRQLYNHQRLHDWKVTLAQQTIGQSVSSDGDNDGTGSRIKLCTTASSLLVQGKLEGQLLHHLIDEEIRVIKNLQLLTMPEELDVSEEVKTEFEDLKSKISSGREVTAADVSSLANTFVGKAIHKNFHPINGRFVMLWQFGKDLASKKIHLKPKEVVPAKHLENLFCKHFGYENGEGSWIPKNSLESTFVLSEEERADLSSDRENYEDPFADTGLDQWKSLLELALSMDHPSATNRIWTCGLTDGGLHNLFLNEENLWMFDLGEPSLEPVPAFLTKVRMGNFTLAALDPFSYIVPLFLIASKFLMSFFHALGMEEDEKGDWVVRFEQDESGKLRLTEKTKELLPKVIAAFNITVDRLIKELFEGYEKVRVLLVRYVVMQLISDSAFCIEKWRTKGGGDELRSDHQYYLQKWLWRALVCFQTVFCSLFAVVHLIDIFRSFYHDIVGYIRF